MRSLAVRILIKRSHDPASQQTTANPDPLGRGTFPNADPAQGRNAN
jgi:hypothetical protein